MMRTRWVEVPVLGLVLSTLAACGGKNETAWDPAHLVACAGNYTGTYKGDLSGMLQGTLAADGTLLLSFFWPGSTAGISFEGRVAPENGSIQLTVQNNHASGKFDPAECKASGSWQSGTDSSGTWQAAK